MLPVTVPISLNSITFSLLVIQFFLGLEARYLRATIMWWEWERSVGFGGQLSSRLPNQHFHHLPFCSVGSYLPLQLLLTSLWLLHRMRSRFLSYSQVFRVSSSTQMIKCLYYYRIDQCSLSWVIVPPIWAVIANCKELDWKKMNKQNTLYMTICITKRLVIYLEGTIVDGAVDATNLMGYQNDLSELLSKMELGSSCYLIPINLLIETFVGFQSCTTYTGTGI